MRAFSSVTLKGNKKIVLYTETTLDDYIALSLVGLASERTDESFEKFIQIREQYSTVGYISVRLCVFNTVKYRTLENTKQ